MRETWHHTHWVLQATFFFLAALLVAAPGRAAGIIHTDTCVRLKPGGHENLPHCPVKHLSDNEYTSLKKSAHKYMLLTKDKPVVLEVKGPGVGLRELYLWKYRDGKIFTGGDYTITIVRDDTEYVEQVFPIKPYPKHEVYGSAERTRVTMPAGTHKLEFHLSSKADGEVIFYWKVAPIDGMYFLDDWKPLPE